MNIEATITLPDGQQTQIIREYDNTISVSHTSSYPNIVSVSTSATNSVSVSESQQNSVTVGSGVYQTVGEGNVWGSINGNIINQTDLVNYIDSEIAAIPTPETPTLQSVTDAGNTTTNSIQVSKILVGDGSYAAPSISFQSDTNTGLYRNAENQLDIVAGGGRFRVDSTNVYGTIGGAFKINLQYGQASAPTYSFNGYDNNGMFRPSGINAVAFSTAGTEKLRITQDGNVGIGTTVPADKLTVSAGNILIDDGRRIKWATGSYIETSADSSLMTFRAPFGDYYFNGGNVGIGTTSPTEKLDVDGKINSTELKVSNKIDTKKDEIEHWNINRDNYVFVQAIDSNPSGIEFIDNGTRMLVCGYTTNRIHEYTLSTAWDLTTATHTNSSQYLPQSGLSSTIEDFFISEDGTRIYVLSRSSDSIGQFDLTTPFDITTMVFVKNVSFGYLDSDPTGIHFKPDGSVLYLCGYNKNDVFQVPLSTPWDISTAGTETFISVNEFGVTAVQYVEFNTDGTQMYIGGYNSDSLYRFDLSAAWDITTASLNSSSFSFRGNSETTTGLYYNDQESKAFIVGRSSDTVYELNINDGVYIGEAAVFEKDVKIDGELESHSVNRFFNVNRFYSTLEAYSTLTGYTTTRAAYQNGSGVFEVGNITYGNALSRFYKNNYGGADGVESTVRFFENIAGGKGRIEIGKDHTSATWLVGGTTHVDSYANTFNHQGEFNLGGELKITGDKPLAYRDLDLRNLGSQVVFDDFTEAVDTYIDAHTPNVGAGYTLVYQSVGIIQDDIPVVSGGNGYLRTGRTNSNDGIMYINDTVINSDNYEVRATIREQHNGDDMFWLIIKYIDQDNYYAMSFSRDYGYCIPVSRVNGVDTVRGNLSYYANISMDDLQSIDVAIRVTGDKVSVFYEGNYRGSFTDSGITQAGRGGFGFGAIIPSVSTAYDIDDEWKISDFEIIEYSDSLFDGSNSVHYIENGKLGIGTTAPVGILHTYSTSAPIFESPSNANLIIKRNDNVNYRATLQYHSGNSVKWAAGLSDAGDFTGSTGNDYFIGTSTNDPKLLIDTSGNVGIGTTTPGTKLHVDGNIRVGDANDVIFTNKLYGLSTGNLTIYTSGNTLLTQTGTVGIGTTAPVANYKLHVVGSSRTALLDNSTLVSIVKITNSGTGNGAYNGLDFVANNTSSSNINSHGMPLTIATSNTNGVQTTERMRITGDGNVGIGTTSPTEKLQIDGAIRATDVKINTGSRFFRFGGSTISILSSSETAVTSNATNVAVGRLGLGSTYSSIDIGAHNKTHQGYTSAIWATSGKDALRIYSSSNSQALTFTEDGNLGIGTTSPSEKLHVFGDVRVQTTTPANTAGTATIEFNPESSTQAYIQSVSNFNPTSPTVYSAGFKFIVKDRDASLPSPYYSIDAMSINANGNVGVNTNTPTEKLHVDGNAKIQGNIYLNDATERYIYGYNNASYIKFYDPSFGGIEIGSVYNHRVRVVTSLLEVTGDFSTGGGFTMSGDLAIGNGNRVESSSGNNGITLYRGSDASMVFQIKHPTVGHYIYQDKDGNDLMILTRDGKLGIGTTAPTSKTHINGTALEQLRLEQQGGPTGNTDERGQVGDIAYDDQYFYVKTTNGWGRVLLDFAF